MNETENTQIALARQIIETTDTHLFLTGKAGTGKTTFLRKLRQERPKRMVVLAPTGIAAINAEGVTIHSFFQLPFSPYIPGTSTAQTQFKLRAEKIKLIRSLDLLVIDEISMVRADLLDAVDNVLRCVRHTEQPFGGVQLLMIGDLQQLAPVVKDDEQAMLSRYYDTPYFFSSLALKRTHYVTVELTKVYRQTDTAFLSLLNSIREGHVSAEVLSAINQRYIPGFDVPAQEGYVRLVTHNHQAQLINQAELNKLPGKAYSYKAKVVGKFPEYSFPTEQELVLKMGAQVMFVKNDANKTYFNGMLGEVVGINDKGFQVRPREDHDMVIMVTPERWTNSRYALDEKTAEISEVVEGEFIQYPVKTAWAITVHKSQGLTFDRVQIDVSGAFAAGQTYVALSRCRTLEGIVLSSLIPPQAVIADPHIEAFNQNARQDRVDPNRLTEMQRQYALHLLTGLFGFYRERALLAAIHRIFEEHLYRIYPETTARYEAEVKQFDLQIVNVSSTFQRQYTELVIRADGNIAEPKLQERISKGAAYFAAKVKAVGELLTHTKVEIDNKDVRKKMDEASKELLAELRLHCRLLLYVAQSGFDLHQYVARRAVLVVEAEQTEKGKQGGKQAKGNSARSASSSQEQLSEDIRNPQLYSRLVQWRREKAASLSVPAYVVMHTQSLIAIANNSPKTATELAAIPHFGRVSMEKYGAEIFRLVNGDGALFDIEAVKFPKEKSAARKPAAAKASAGKVAKENTREISYRLFREGLQVQEIAQRRGLAVSTIRCHLENFVLSGDIPTEQLVSDEHFRRVEAYLKSLPDVENHTLTEIRQGIGEDVDFAEIRLVMRLLNKS